MPARSERWPGVNLSKASPRTHRTHHAFLPRLSAKAALGSKWAGAVASESPRTGLSPARKQATDFSGTPRLHLQKERSNAYLRGGPEGQMQIVTKVQAPQWVLSERCSSPHTFLGTLTSLCTPAPPLQTNPVTLQNLLRAAGHLAHTYSVEPPECLRRSISTILSDLRGKYYYHSYFRSRKTRAQRGSAAGPRSHSSRVAEPGFGSRRLAPEQTDKACFPPALKKRCHTTRLLPFDKHDLLCAGVSHTCRTGKGETGSQRRAGARSQILISGPARAWTQASLGFRQALRS